MMSFDNLPMQDVFGEHGRIELSHAIATLLGGTEDKENKGGPSSHHTASSYLESSSINKTPHDGTLNRSSARQHCRRLEGRETTPRKRREPRRHLNSVNILCRSKRRKLSEKQATSQEMGFNLAAEMDDMGDLQPLIDSRRYRHLRTLQDSNVQLVNQGGAPAMAGSGVMVKDSAGKLHPAEFVPVMVEEQNEGYLVADSAEVMNSQENNKAAIQQDESLTNITWLKKMSAPDVDAGDPAQPPASSEVDCERPPYSYSALIQFALISTNVGKMTLKEIYDWIQFNFPFFKSAKLGWKNSIRHNLSLHKIFIREPPDGPGKPAYWTLRTGTVVRLPENRLFVMEGMGPGHSRSRRPKACIKQADGTTQMISENHIPPPPKPKPILPRIPAGCTLVTMPMVSGLSSDTVVSAQRSSRGRYPRIAPKQMPIDQLTSWYFPTTSIEASPIPCVDVQSYETPKRCASPGQPGPSTESVEPSMNNPAPGTSVGAPTMSTPVKKTTTPSRILDSMDPLTPLRGVSDSDEFTLLRNAGELSGITPIKGTGMTPIITEFLSQSGDLQVTPVRRPRSGPGVSPMSTPVVTAADPNELSFNLEDLFGADLNPLSNGEGSPNSYSFSHLFSPISRK